MVGAVVGAVTSTFRAGKAAGFKRSGSCSENWGGGKYCRIVLAMPSSACPAVRGCVLMPPCPGGAAPGGSLTLGGGAGGGCGGAVGGVGALSVCLSTPQAQPSHLAWLLTFQLTSPRSSRGLELRVTWPGMWGASTEPAGCLC